jgi:hypothetical protein
MSIRKTLCSYVTSVVNYLQKISNYSSMSIGRPIAILCFLARKITAEGAEVRRVVNRLFPLRVPPRTLRLDSLFGYSIPQVPSSLCIVKSPDSGFRYLSSYKNNKEFHPHGSLRLEMFGNVLIYS